MRAADYPAPAIWRLPHALTQAEPPVTPDGDEARRWAVEELSKPVYHAAEPSWLDSLWRQFLDWLRSLNGGDPGVDGGLALPIIGAAAVLLIVMAVVLARPRLNARRRPPKGVVDVDPAISADAYRRSAAAAAARSDWPTAVVEQFRAMVRSAEDRGIVDPHPGRTADEVAARLAGSFGQYASELRQAAAGFDAIRYGKAGATESDHAALVSLDQALRSARPDHNGSSADHLALPL